MINRYYIRLNVLYIWSIYHATFKHYPLNIYINFINFVTSSKQTILSKSQSIKRNDYHPSPKFLYHQTNIKVCPLKHVAFVSLV